MCNAMNINEEENIIEMAEHSPHASICRISACLHVLHMKIWETLEKKIVTIPYPMNSISHARGHGYVVGILQPV
jgi:hypothetical protein